MLKRSFAAGITGTLLGFNSGCSCDPKLQVYEQQTTTVDPQGEKVTELSRFNINILGGLFASFLVAAALGGIVAVKNVSTRTDNDKPSPPSP